MARAAGEGCHAEVCRQGLPWQGLPARTAMVRAAGEGCRRELSRAARVPWGRGRRQPRTKGDTGIRIKRFHQK